VARWMVEHGGVRYLVITGRSGPSDAALDTIRELEQTGARVIVAQADVSRIDDVATVLNMIERDLPPLRGVIHAAGVVDDGVLVQQTWERFARVLAPKVSGSWNLHQLTAHLPLDFFVLFSSIASVMVNGGQGNYVAANAFVDALAHFRRARGLPATSINWGPWGNVGMALNVKNIDHRLAREGLQAIEAREGMDLFARILREEPVQILAVSIDWAMYVARRAGSE